MKCDRPAATAAQTKWRREVGFAHAPWTGPAPPPCKSWPRLRVRFPWDTPLPILVRNCSSWPPPFTNQCSSKHIRSRFNQSFGRTGLLNTRLSSHVRPRRQPIISGRCPTCCVRTNPWSFRATSNEDGKEWAPIRSSWASWAANESSCRSESAQQLVIWWIVAVNRESGEPGAGTAAAAESGAAQPGAHGGQWGGGRGRWQRALHPQLVGGEEGSGG